MNVTLAAVIVSAGLGLPSPAGGADGIEGPTASVPVGPTRPRSDGPWQRAVFYGRQAEGAILSCLVRRGMTPEQVRNILGEWDSAFGGIGGFTYFYRALGVTVDFPLPSDLSQPRQVESVRWYFRWYSPKP
jgi:hypothetical protein